MMDTPQMQQILRNYGHSDARAVIEGKQSYEWERALSAAGLQDAATVVTKFVPRQASLNDMPTTGRAAGPQPPAGKTPVQTLDEFEALPQAERLARMAEADFLLLQQDGAA
jgi:hypothetical protein